jgi:hypothetical protein
MSSQDVSPHDSTIESRAAKANPGSLNCQGFFIKGPKYVLLPRASNLPFNYRGVIEKSVSPFLRIENGEKEGLARRLP